MIDVHSHVLWGLDDGAETRDESVAMLRMAAEYGTTDIVASPHSDLRFNYDPCTVAARIADLSREPGLPRIHRGCDFHMSIENVERALADHRPYTINGLNHLLIEFADILIPPSTEEILSQFTGRGIVPIVTHPERNPILQRSISRLKSWIDMGCLMQVTAQCLSDRFGRKARKTAWHLLRSGLVHVIASDGHDTDHRPPRLDMAYRSLEGEFGEGRARLLTIENPGAIIAGGEVRMAAPPEPRRRRWWYPFR
jgi:protein-tyrosine phosphatase